MLMNFHRQDVIALDEMGGCKLQDVALALGI
jgi:hypothetical protein